MRNSVGKAEVPVSSEAKGKVVSAQICVFLKEFEQKQLIGN